MDDTTRSEAGNERRGEEFFHEYSVEPPSCAFRGSPAMMSREDLERVRADPAAALAELKRRAKTLCRDARRADAGSTSRSWESADLAPEG